MNPEQYTLAYKSANALLGAVISGDNTAACERLAPEHMPEYMQQIILVAIKALQSEGISCDPITLAKRLDAQGMYEKVGGEAALATIALNRESSAVSEAVVKALSDNVMEFHKKQAVTKFTSQLLIDFNDSDFDQSVAKFTESLEGVTVNNGEDHTHVISAGELMLNRFQAGLGGHNYTIDSLPPLNNALKGLYKGRYYIVGAPSKAGKTALAVNNMAMDIAKQGGRVLFVSTEMDQESILTRLLASEANIPIDSIMGGRCQRTEEGRQALAKAVATIKSLPFEFTTEDNLPRIIALANRMKRTIGLDAIVIDYIQNVATTVQKSDGEVQRIASISREINKLKHLGIVVIGLSQVNEKGELKGTGEMKHNADYIIKIEKIFEQVGDKTYPQHYIAVPVSRHSTPQDCFKYDYSGNPKESQIAYWGGVTKFKPSEAWYEQQS